MNTGAALVRMLGSLTVVVVLMLFVAKVLQRTRFGGRAPNLPGIRVIARQSLGKHAALLMVEAAGKVLLVSVSAGTVSLLRELDELPAPDADAEPAGNVKPLRQARPARPARPARMGTPDVWLDRLRDMTVRRVG